MRRTLKRLVNSLYFAKRAAVVAPHPEKRHRGGEDAFLTHDSALGVADGVGGYAESGVNPAIFTRQVMQHTLEAIASNTCGGSLTALQALESGFKKTLALKTVGGCPVTLVTIVDGTFGSFLNLGDCGSILLRGGRPMYRTTVQQHYFNCPYQLPDDRPTKGLTAKIPLQVGDVLFLASDGVFDNVPDATIVEQLNAVQSETCSSTDAANRIADLATRYGADRNFDSPFAKYARENGYRFIGGKQDDVTVVIGVVALRVAGATVVPSSCPSLIEEVFP